MKSFLLPVTLALACICALVAGRNISCIWIEKREEKRLRQKTRLSLGVENHEKSEGLLGVLLHYLERLSEQLKFKTTRSLMRQKIPLQSKKSSRYAAWFQEQVNKAGLAIKVSPEGFREARIRLALLGGGLGALMGAVLSNELAVLLGLIGCFMGSHAPRWALKAEKKRRTIEVERHLSPLLEVVALGLRSGLSFEQSFDLYGAHFTCSLAQACISASKSWQLGHASREEALRRLAASFDSLLLERTIENIIRSLRFGSAFAETLEVSAAEARAEHRARMEERAAKAPVKMMMPTGVLILPAMLILVMGPIVLELAQEF